MKSSFLVDSYIEESRIRKPVSYKEFIRRLKNLYTQAVGENPPDDFIFSDSDKRVEVKFYNPDHLPGVAIVSGKVLTDELENKYLKGLGWEVIGAFSIPGTNYDINLPKDYTGLRVPKSIFSISIGFESRQEKETLEKPRYLYHASPTEFVGRILKNGLKPSSRSSHVSFRYSQRRVYLFTGFDSYLMSGFISDYGEVKDFTIFEIDTNKFDKFRIYSDKSSNLMKKDGFPFSVYTKTHIPPHAIKIVGRRRV